MSKILSLEEIEKMVKTYDAVFRIEPNLGALLATARAYHELKAASKDIVDIDQSSVFGLPEDKPHAPTIKAIFEWLSADRYNRGFEDLSSQELVKRIESNLESILKDLNN